MSFLDQRKRARFTAFADDTTGSTGKTGEVLGLAAVRAGGQLGSEAGDERELQPEGEGGFEVCRARLGWVVEQRQVAAEEVVGGWVRLGRVEQAQHCVAGAGTGGEG